MEASLQKSGDHIVTMDYVYQKTNQPKNRLGRNQKKEDNRATCFTLFKEQLRMQVTHLPEIAQISPTAEEIFHREFFMCISDYSSLPVQKR